MLNGIEIKGARTHNLKNISLNICQGKITCLAGPSGSGKSSLALSTLYLESKRRFLNSLPTAQKFFWDLPQACDVDSISPVLPTWLLPQNNPVSSSRTNIADLLGLTTDFAKLFYKYQQLYCEEHQCEYERSSYEYFLKQYFSTKKRKGPFYILASVNSQDFSGMSFSRSLCQDTMEMREYSEEDQYVELFRTKKDDPIFIAERIKEFSLYQLWIFSSGTKDLTAITVEPNWICPLGGEKLPLLSSFHHFNPLQSIAACKECRGMGDKLEYDRRKIIPNKRLSLEEGACTLLAFKKFKKQYDSFFIFCKKEKINIKKPFEEVETEEIWKKMERGGKDFSGLYKLYDVLEKKRYKKPYRIFSRKFKSEFVCEMCQGTRIERELYSYFIPCGELRFHYHDVFNCSLEECIHMLSHCLIEDRLLEDVKRKLEIAIELGLSHLFLKDNAKNLSTSEYQRSLLVKYFSYQGSGSLFILDEPSIGLSVEEQKILLKFLKELKNSGNTILLIEHSTFLQKNSDEIIWMGPQAGSYGGEIVYQGKWKKEFAQFPGKLIPPKVVKSGTLKLKGALYKSFHMDDFELPLGLMVYVKGEISSGVRDFFNIVVANELSKNTTGELVNFDKYELKKMSLTGTIDKIISFSYESHSYSARSTIGTLLGLTPVVRKYYASLHESKVMNLKDGHFSPNSEMGKCRGCEGRGIQAIEMDILEDVVFTCPDCQGKKIIPMYADISDGHQTFYEAISQGMEQVLSRISLTPKFTKIFDYMKRLRLEYLSLDRSFNSLSGGEKQRVLLVLEILKGDQNVFYLFENLSAGLSLEDLYHVATFLQDVSSQGNSVIILDQHPIWESVCHRVVEY